MKYEDMLFIEKVTKEIEIAYDVKTMMLSINVYAPDKVRQVRVCVADFKRIGRTLNKILRENKDD